MGHAKSSPLPTTHPLRDLPNRFNDYFCQKIESIRAVLDQSVLSSPVFTLSNEASALSTFSAFGTVTV